ncbi:uncharacterized protein [Palaemon carinicauda]|uniref:uncharacterized protein n=1 Tax=Palaemon carinicauda TaxID=392227 RepID=UPI0035B57A1E
MPISIATSCSNKDKTVRCMNKNDVPLRRLIATFIGPVPSSLDLGVWGTNPIEEYTPEPLRCYRCQQYGHHKEECKGPITCGVFSQRHSTEVCIQAHKDGRKTNPKCHNCYRLHHAWNRRCAQRLRRIAVMKTTSSLKQPKTTTSQPPPQGPATSTQKKTTPANRCSFTCTSRPVESNTYSTTQVLQPTSNPDSTS